MALPGLISLLVAFAGIVVGVVCLVAGSAMGSARNAQGRGETLAWAGHVAVLAVLASLTFACLLLVYCFLTGDTSIEYVVRGTSHETAPIGNFYRLAGLWEGREGSLLFWAWLISLFAGVIAARNMRNLDKMDNAALVVLLAVLGAFASIMLFSEDNSPFRAMDPQYFDAEGNLTGAAALWGMNPLLEHWAMAVHPPALFLGYAGLTVPFAYAVAALVVNDASDKWVRRSQRYAMLAWWFLGIGIGLGAVWAYVVLGWGGYWGWDPVENASLLPWLVGLALIHSFTVYRQRGAFKRWAIMCSALTFAFVITGTFISRSGLIESVHAFTGDPVSINLFGAMIVVSLVVAAGGLITRWKSFAPLNAADEELGSFMSRDAAYYFNNVIMVVFAFVVCYLTVSAALPSFLPFGGQSLSAGTYNAIARPLGIFYCLVLAVCPLLAWVKTDAATLLKRGRVPALCAAVLFVLLMIYLVVRLWPAYDATIAAGGRVGEGLASEGPAWYYKGLAAVGFAVASLVIFNTLFMLVRRASAWGKAHGCSTPVALFKMIPGHVSTFGGYIAHFGIGVILIGLIGSAMFVTEHSGYVKYDATTDTAADYSVGEYTLKYTGNSVEGNMGDRAMYYTVEFDVYKNGTLLGHVAPNMELAPATQQTKANAAIVGQPLEDLFVVYQGVNDLGYYSMNLRINPLIRFVWAGFAILMIGVAVAALGRRTPKGKGESESLPEAEDGPGSKADDGDGSDRKASGAGDADGADAEADADADAEIATDADADAKDAADADDANGSGKPAGDDDDAATAEDAAAEADAHAESDAASAREDGE